MGPFPGEYAYFYAQKSANWTLIPCQTWETDVECTRFGPLTFLARQRED